MRAVVSSPSSSRLPALVAPSGAKSHTRQVPEAGVAVSTREGAIIFGLVATVAVAVAAWLSFVVQDVMGDALSRTYAAFAAVHSAQPHLAAIGFIWPPLPTILQIPLVIIPRLSFYGFSGGVMCALFAGLTAAVVNLILARAGLTRWLRWSALALFFLNPLIAFYSANGMSEIPFVYCFVQALYCFLRWQETDHWVWIAFTAFACAMMVLVRYDALFFSAAFVAALVLMMLGSRRTFDRAHIEANILAALTPIIFTTGLWTFFNWQIKGDALYFLHSEYSNTYLVRDQTMAAEVQRIHDSLFAFGRYLCQMTFFLSPLLLAALFPLALLALRRRTLHPLALAGLLFVVPLFQAYTYRQGQTFGFLRFYISLIPAGLIAGCEIIRMTRSARGQRIAVIALLVGLAIGNVTTTYAMDRVYFQPGLCDPTSSPEQVFLRSFLHPTRTRNACRTARDMAGYITEHVHDRAVITDVSGNTVVVFSAHPERFVLLSDRDYDLQARNRPSVVRFVLLSRTVTPEFRALDGYFPGLDSGIYPGSQLVHENGEYRLYYIAP